MKGVFVNFVNKVIISTENKFIKGGKCYGTN